MRVFFLLLFLFISVCGCKNISEQDQGHLTLTEETNYSTYSSSGEEFIPEKILTAKQLGEGYDDLKPGDSLEVVFKSTVNSVCEKKGCWMTLNIDDEEEVMVKFKDYGFFVPKNIEDKIVVVRGLAYVTEVSVEEQQHLAEDGEKTAEEVSKITKPKKTLSFMADGVLIAP